MSQSQSSDHTSPPTARFGRNQTILHAEIVVDRRDPAGRPGQEAQQAQTVSAGDHYEEDGSSSLEQNAAEAVQFSSGRSKYRTPMEMRRHFIGGSDARIIMGADEEALIRLWREKRGEAEPEDLADDLIVQLGVATEDLNKTWFERNTSKVVRDVQRRIRHPIIRWMGATLDGMTDGGAAIFEAKFMLPWSFSEEAAADKHMAQLQHNMWVAQVKSASLSIITGGGKWVEMTIPADPLYQHLLITAEKHFWRCVAIGERPHPFGIEPPRPPVAAIRIVDMSASNAWAELAGLYRRTRAAHSEHERAKAELKALMPEDAKEAIGHGLRGKRSKSGAIGFDLLSVEGIESIQRGQIVGGQSEPKSLAQQLKNSIALTRPKGGEDSALIRKERAARKQERQSTNGGGDDAALQ